MCDQRYIVGITFDDFVNALEMLNQKGVDYLISYDRQCGDKVYGQELPEELGYHKVYLDAGYISQSLAKKQGIFGN